MRPGSCRGVWHSVGGRCRARASTAPIDKETTWPRTRRPSSRRTPTTGSPPNSSTCRRRVAKRSPRIEAAREEGDLKENGGYHAAKDEQGKQEARIRTLQALLKDAVVGEARSPTAP
jgi:hypothetical protein